MLNSFWQADLEPGNHYQFFQPNEELRYVEMEGNTALTSLEMFNVSMLLLDYR